MGYYDDHSTEGQPQRLKGSRNSWFWAGLLGAIVGIVVLLVLAPVLSDLGVMPYTVSTNGAHTAAASSGNNSSPSKVYNVNMKSQATKAVGKVSSAVVGVLNLQKANNFQNKLQKSAIGSGIIYKKANGSAYVVTNAHVVEGAAGLEVQFKDNTKVKAKLLGKDTLYDLAVLKIPSAKVKSVAQFGNSTGLKRGQSVIAIGNPLGFSGSVTKGVVSSQNRVIPVTHGHVSIQAHVIQTDAAINPGNSGGALINLAGQVVGINSMKIVQQKVQGIGFAIPIDVAKPVIKKLENNGKINRPYIGISIVGLDQVPSNAYSSLNLPSSVKNGLVVRSVQNGSPAAAANLKSGDVIVEINGKKIKNYVDFSTYLYTHLNPGQTVDVKYYRNGKLASTKLKLGSKEFK